jgi:hypothetical protein
MVRLLTVGKRTWPRFWGAICPSVSPGTAHPLAFGISKPNGTGVTQISTDASDALIAKWRGVTASLVDDGGDVQWGPLGSSTTLELSATTGNVERDDRQELRAYDDRGNQHAGRSSTTQAKQAASTFHMPRQNKVRPDRYFSKRSCLVVRKRGGSFVLHRFDLNAQGDFHIHPERLAAVQPEVVPLERS